MFICPLPNKGILSSQQWLQKRPLITQGFGLNPDIYKQFDMRGHNAIDYACEYGEMLYMPYPGNCTVEDDGSGGYGLHIRLKTKTFELVLGHLSKVLVTNGEYKSLGEKIGLAGNSGFCLPKPTKENPRAGTHLHMGMRELNSATGNVVNYDNGFKGYIDFSSYIIYWKI